MRLKRSHNYFYQVQSMGCTGRQWCDFVCLSNTGEIFERIFFNQTFWESCVARLAHFFCVFFAPMIVYPKNMHHSFSLSFWLLLVFAQIFIALFSVVCSRPWDILDTVQCYQQNNHAWGFCVCCMSTSLTTLPAYFLFCLELPDSSLTYYNNCLFIEKPWSKQH